MLLGQCLSLEYEISATRKKGLKRVQKQTKNTNNWLVGSFVGKKGSKMGEKSTKMGHLGHCRGMKLGQKGQKMDKKARKMCQLGHF